jgi:uncharacterized protein YndB with AHSA1/START domain
MAPIVASIEVDRPADDVFSYATDPGRFAEWQKGVVAGPRDDAGSATVGARCVTTRRVGFMDRPVTSEVTHVDAPRTWGVRGIDGPIRAVVDLTVEPVSDSSSRLTIAIDFEGRGIGRILVPLVVLGEARKEMPANLALLKRRLEGTGAGPQQ